MLNKILKARVDIKKCAERLDSIHKIDDVLDDVPKWMRKSVARIEKRLEKEMLSQGMYGSVTYEHPALSIAFFNINRAAIYSIMADHGWKVTAKSGYTRFEWAARYGSDLFTYDDIPLGLTRAQGIWINQYLDIINVYSKFLGKGKDNE